MYVYIYTYTCTHIYIYTLYDLLYGTCNLFQFSCQQANIRICLVSIMILWVGLYNTHRRGYGLATRRFTCPAPESLGPRGVWGAQGGCGKPRKRSLGHQVMLGLGWVSEGKSYQKCMMKRGYFPTLENFHLFFSWYSDLVGWLVYTCFSHSRILEVLMFLVMKHARWLG